VIEPAPAYRGEGPHALWHVSEDPTIERFAVRHADAGIRLETDDELLGLWDRVVGSTLDFSGIRLRNARLPA
jgi:hypothetical protein